LGFLNFALYFKIFIFCFNSSSYFYPILIFHFFFLL
jgi:hypothetical protein